MTHLNMQTPDGAQLNLEALYKICPSCFTESSNEDGTLKHVVDWNKLRSLLGENVEDGAPESYDFTWVGKRAAQREAAAPINKTLRPCPEESVDWDTTQNLYIEGDNLEVLKLLQNSYMGKVKMIYIDPPYNTGNDFVYHDDFAQSADEYDEHNINEDGERFRKNTDSNGRFHSDWCSMMYARLMVARSLMREDGLICISIDDNEILNLRKLCNEIFGETNCVAQLVWKNKYGAGGGTNSVAYVHEYILIYAKAKVETITCELSEELKATYNKKDEKFAKRGGYTTQPLASTSKGARANLMYAIEHEGELIFPPKGGRWVWSKEKFDEAYKNNEIVINKTSEGWSVRAKNYLYDVNGNIRKGTQLSIITNVYNQEGTKEFAELLGDKRIFDFPKPTSLILQLLKLEINQSPNEDDIILDFFGGSSSTAHAVLKFNKERNAKCHFVIVQWPEKTEDGSIAKKNGYNNICEIGKERIRRAGSKIKEETGLFADNLDTGFRVFKCDSSNMKDVYFAPKDLDQQDLYEQEDNIKSDRSDLDLLFDCMLRWGVELSMPMATKKVGGCTIHNVNDGDLVACFDGKITEDIIDAIAAMSPLRVVFRDSSFEEASQKMNLFELFKQKCQWTDAEVKNNVKVI